MLNIELDNKYCISSDSMNYMLQRKGIVKEGKTIGLETISTIGYYSTLKNVLKAYKELLIRESDIKTIQELLVAIITIDNHIQEVLGGN